MLRPKSARAVTKANLSAHHTQHAAGPGGHYIISRISLLTCMPVCTPVSCKEEGSSHICAMQDPCDSANPHDSRPHLTPLLGITYSVLGSPSPTVPRAWCTTAWPLLTAELEHGPAARRLLEQRVLQLDVAAADTQLVAVVQRQHQLCVGAHTIRQPQVSRLMFCRTQVSQLRLSIAASVLATSAMRAGKLVRQVQTGCRRLCTKDVHQASSKAVARDAPV